MRVSGSQITELAVERTEDADEPETTLSSFRVDPSAKIFSRLLAAYRAIPHLDEQSSLELDGLETDRLCAVLSDAADTEGNGVVSLTSMQKLRMCFDHSWPIVGRYLAPILEIFADASKQGIQRRCLHIMSKTS